jgi:hypothetical protein
MKRKADVLTESGKEKCPDCHYCQICSKSRCRLCRRERPEAKAWELGTSFTYGRYLEWKRSRQDGQDALH